MRWRLVILDFDGTFTVLEAEIYDFRREFLARAQARTRLDTPAFQALYERMLRRVHRYPHLHGWRYRDHLIAAGTVDPYTELRTVVELIFRETKAFPSHIEAEHELDQYFLDLRQFVRPTFKPSAGRVLETIVAHGHNAHFVSNTKTDIVRRDLGTLADRHPTMAALADNAHGHAHKWVVEPNHRGFPVRGLYLPGFKRVMHVRRPRYFETLNKLRLAARAEWDQVLVVGDIFELDLATPLALGAHVALVDHPRVPTYERAFIAAHPRARLIATIEDILALIAA